MKKRIMLTDKEDSFIFSYLMSLKTYPDDISDAE